jgi:hypothetical protein
MCGLSETKRQPQIQGFLIPKFVLGVSDIGNINRMPVTQGGVFVLCYSVKTSRLQPARCPYYFPEHFALRLASVLLVKFCGCNAVKSTDDSRHNHEYDMFPKTKMR